MDWILNLNRLNRFKRNFDNPSDPFNPQGSDISNVGPQQDMNNNVPQEPIAGSHAMHLPINNELPDPTPMSDAYQKNLQEMPQMPHPGFLRKIAAVGLGGLSGTFDNAQQAAHDTMYAPYDRSMVDWKNKNSQLAESARIEEAQSRGKNEEIKMHNAADALAVREQAAGNLKAHQERVDNLALLKFQHPNLTYKTNANGSIIGIDPQTNESFDTGVKSIDMTPDQKIKLALDQIDKRNEGAIKQIDERGKMREKEIELTNAGRLRDIGAQGANARSVAEIGAASREKVAGMPGRVPSADRSLTPSQQANDRLNKANLAINQHPEWKDYIKIDGKNITVTPANNGGFFSSGPSPVMREQILKAIGMSDSVAKPDPAGIR